MTAGDAYDLRCILTAEEQRLQGELLDASDSFLHDVRGIAGSAAEKLTLLNQVEDLREQIRVKVRAEDELLAAAEEQESILKKEVADERQNRLVRERDLMVQITNLSQHADTLTRHVQEFENLSEEWRGERRGLEQQSVDLLLKIKHLQEDSDRNFVLFQQERQALTLAQQQGTQQHSQQHKQLQEDLDCSLRFQQALQVRMREEQEAAKDEHKRSQASLLLIRLSQEEEMRQKFVTLMAENEKLVQDKLECFQRESRLEDLWEEAQVGLRDEL